MKKAGKLSLPALYFYKVNSTTTVLQKNYRLGLTCTR